MLRELWNELDKDFFSILSPDLDGENF